jgi:hypothetical protein
MTDTDIMPMDEALEAARTAGTEHGRAAATWAFDGNTTDETYATVVRGLDAGDPETYDGFGHLEPGIDGRDQYTSRQLCDDIGVDYDGTEVAEVAELAEAYEQAARDAFWADVERTARKTTE